MCLKSTIWKWYTFGSSLDYDGLKTGSENDSEPKISWFGSILQKQPKKAKTGRRSNEITAQIRQSSLVPLPY